MDEAEYLPKERSDHSTTIADVRAELRAFVAERDWQQFHAPKNLAMALAVEAAELMEHFQWIDVAESRAIDPSSEKAQAIGEEIADVFCYTLAMADQLGIDLSDAFTRKMRKNRLKYPAEVFRGRYGAGDTNSPQNPAGD